MKQTAIEWLLENLNSEPYSEEEFNHNSNCWDKALEIEKEHIEDAYAYGYADGFDDVKYDDEPKGAEQYYKQTYESKT